MAASHHAENSGKRSRWGRLLICASLLANVAALLCLAYVIQGRGGFTYLKSHLTHRSEAAGNLASMHRQSLFELLQAEAQARPIVFLGDSLTSSCEWRELFGNRGAILNRGIGGETSLDVLRRSAGVAAMHPLAVFVMVGANDPQELGYTPAQTLDNLGQIVRTFRQGSPDTTIYLQSILPTRAPRFNRWSDRVNQGLAAMADGERLRFIDLRPAFLHGEAVGEELVVDGIHLSGKGYLVWKKGIESEINRLISCQERDRSGACPSASSPTPPAA